MGLSFLIKFLTERYYISQIKVRRCSSVCVKFPSIRSRNSNYCSEVWKDETNVQLPRPPMLWRKRHKPVRLPPGRLCSGDLVLCLYLWSGKDIQRSVVLKASISHHPRIAPITKKPPINTPSLTHFDENIRVISSKSPM